MFDMDRLETRSPDPTFEHISKLILLFIFEELIKLNSERKISCRRAYRLRLSL